ncbi:MAG: hypothetical protein WKF66_19865 [Pedobacter sp.]
MKKTMRYLCAVCLVLLSLLRSVDSSAQEKFPYDSFLEKQPYFATHKVIPTDSLFIQDVKILRHYLDLDSIDMELLKPNVLSALMLEQVNAGKASTFKVLVDYFKDFKNSISYQDFRNGVILYRKMERQPVNLSNWENDKQLFVKLGFTESDLEDFKEYISQRAPKNINYKEAYVGYMKEIEALP